jgi:hypothetical protein
MKRRKIKKKKKKNSFIVEKLEHRHCFLQVNLHS